MRLFFIISMLVTACSYFLAGPTWLTLAGCFATGISFIFVITCGGRASGFLEEVVSILDSFDL
ncbi:hypothetical protein A2348_00860 [Candidatus Uhrbacteria bacterium RIFOXYB12_FULL_58_10]|uniref:Uncharacterized protein n=1 Tax=Candidatus Uhrbacteria bacterium RIFOXYB2_FULL_57_15 TaxID=1802422 RepID=A0A1F7W8C5_9BACT|nr:MAG: hypothetical protein A2348_00860 [Candidatus Uhrbacteria bacterium RIFOXYB12_FULL_58_10]OGL98344.1 MAG: hypothetical protein A2304_01450 [Candidatus Uhrbacteria bacterium RIFOXYB2_FULL_57_15]OGM00201.1 MAG: hypothetical protein A2501_01505 [Candidatus Uhrbacteria bacterium RIFOXYC12_FULL_57_11]